jgi:hypothetical protein
MAEIKDFILKAGLVVNTSAIVNGVDVLANDFTTYTTLNGQINIVQDNVSGLLGSALANDGVTLGLALANDYSTYTTLQSEYAANDGVTLSSARANDFSTYTTLQSEYAANDGVTLSSARANDYSTYTTLVNEYSANDFATYSTLLSEARANDFATWSGLNSAINIKANSSVNILAGDGLTGGGDLSANVSVAVDSTVVRTSGNQSISGIKTFNDSVVVVGDLTVEGNTVSIGTTSLLVSDKFIELAANTVGTPAGDVGIYLNRGDFGNSAIYYDQAAGGFALADTADPSTNVQVSPTSYANLRVNAIRVDSSSLVTNLNAELLDGQQGAYYLDFGNLSNTSVITLDRVTANGSTTTSSISVGGLSVDGDTLYVDSANDRVGINTFTPGSSLQIKDAALETTSLTTTTATADQIVDSWSASTFRTAKYLLQVHDTNTNEYHTSELLLTHNGTTVYLTEYAIIYTAASLANFNADISGGNVRLLCSPVGTNNVVKAYRQLLTV